MNKIAEFRMNKNSKGNFALISTLADYFNWHIDYICAHDIRTFKRPKRKIVDFEEVSLTTMISLLR